MSDYRSDREIEFDRWKGLAITGIARPEPSKERRSDEAVVITFDDGTKRLLWLEADCCSHSFFTDVNQFDELLGATIQNVEERDGEVEGDKYAGDVKAWHFLVFETNKGHVTIDWRNESNGYYDGWVVVEAVQ
jgi:hypothetical protein